MDFDAIRTAVESFANANPLTAVAIGLFLVFLIWRKPKFFFSVLALVVLLAGIYYVIMDMASSARSEKARLINKEEREDSP